MVRPNRRGRSPARGPGRRRPRRGALVPLLPLALLGSCVSYRPAPLDPPAMLSALERAPWSASLASPATGAPALTPARLSALAVTHQPALAALRAELGVSRARLVEAGLLPDPQLGWDAMDVVAAEIETGSSGAQEVLSGLGLMFPLPRPGERDARVDLAGARRDRVRAQVLEAEWRLVLEVHLACEELAGARRLLDQAAALTELARSTDDYFQRAEQAGAATAIQASLARGQLHSFRLDVLAAEARLERARQRLNALVGLPPGFELDVTLEEDPAARPVLGAPVEELTAHAVTARPDLAERLAAYAEAEQELRLAVSQQYPLVAVGTGLSLVPGLMSRFGRPAIDTALARREALRLEVESRVHAVRREVAAARARWETARRELELVETELLPSAEGSLEHSRVALEAGEVTLFESLALQRALVEARTRHTSARIEVSTGAWELLSASGLLLPLAPAREELPR